VHAVEGLTQEVRVLKKEVALVKSRFNSKATWRLPDFGFVECNQSFLDLFGWKSVPQVFFLNNLLKVEIHEMFMHCKVLREFLDNPYDTTPRQITKKFKRQGTTELFKCAVILTLDLKKHAFITELSEL